MSLRYRLLILVAVALAPPLAITAYNTLRWQFFLEREFARGSTRRRASRVGRVIADRRRLPTIDDRDGAPSRGARERDRMRRLFQVGDRGPADLPGSCGDRAGRKVPLLDHSNSTCARRQRPAVFFRPAQDRRTHRRHAGAGPRDEVDVDPHFDAIQARRRCHPRRDRSDPQSGTCGAGAVGATVANQSSRHRARPGGQPGLHDPATGRGGRAQDRGASVPRCAVVAGRHRCRARHARARADRRLFATRRCAARLRYRGRHRPRHRDGGCPSHRLAQHRVCARRHCACDRRHLLGHQRTDPQAHEVDPARGQSA